MALPKSFENLVKSWKKLKIDVGDRVWENSRHTCLFKMHPEEYKKCIINFLQLVIRNKKIKISFRNMKHLQKVNLFLAK